MLIANDENYKTLVAGSLPVLVDFHATWCPPCKKMAPALESVAQKLRGVITVAKADVEECMDATLELDIKEVPTLVLYRNGAVHATHSGAMGEKDLEAWITTQLQAPKTA